VGDGNPGIIEDWYYAVWSYNGFVSSNHPDRFNAIYPLRGEYSCDLRDGFNHNRTQFAYQELVFGCVKHPPVVDGVPLWSGIPVTLPAFVPAFDPAAMDIATPQPPHGDPTPGTLPQPIAIDSPGAVVAQPFIVAGWAVDYAAPTGTGIDAVHVYAYPSDAAGVTMGSPLFLGEADYGGSRPDVATAFGNPDFVSPSYYLTVRGLEAGFYQLVVYARSTLTGSWYAAYRLVQVQWGGLLHVGTPLEQTTGEQWSFLTADFDGDRRDDLIGVKMNGTGCGNTEVHVLSGTSGFQQWRSHSCTPLEATQAGQWSFAAADWNRDGVADLVAVKKNSTACSRTEVHILSGAANFSQWLLHACTALEMVSADQWMFRAGDFNGDGVPDLLGIKMNQTGCGGTEVHVMSGAANFGQWLLQGCTGLETTNSDWTFAVGDHDGDDRADLYAIHMRNTATGSTEVHALSAASRYERFTLHTGSALHTTAPEQWAFNIARFNDNGFPDLVAIKMNGTGTAFTEVHVLGW